MGLDIYFHKTKRSNWNKIKKEIDAFNALPEEEKNERYHKEEYPDKGFEPEEIGYFRKVNFLMQFFDYEGNCEYKVIDRSELEELQSRCNRVLNHKDDKELAASLLPPQAGFFFGNTDINEYYYGDVKEVRDWVDKVLEELADDEVVLMYAWW